MGITVINKEQALLVIGCLHCHGTRAFWNHLPDGLGPVDVWFKNFPLNGRFQLFQKTCFLACAECASNLDEIAAQEGKLFTA
jgi:hypothetical protein